MIKRRKLKFDGDRGTYQGEAKGNWLCSTELFDWVNLPEDFPDTIWLCVSTAIRSEVYAYPYFIRDGAVHFVTREQAFGNEQSPLATSPDDYWNRHMPHKGWTWIEYEEDRDD